MFILKGLPLLIAKLSNNRLVPDRFEHRDIWHKPAGGFALPWMHKLAHGDKKFWLPDRATPVTHPTPTGNGNETFGGSSHEKMAENDLPSSLDSLPPAGVHQAVEGTHNGKYDV